ncbi:MAG: hypothetical protein EAS52_01655 [Parapedobacter sp.]|nr:MAG: hypothetical protein EAS52_01655 [Parapedobacter sp.]
MAIPVAVNAQEYMLGMTRSEVMRETQHLRMTSGGSGNARGFLYDDYRELHAPYRNTTRFYFGEDGKCHAIMEAVDRSVASLVMEEIRDRFVHMIDNIWTSTDNEVQATIIFDRDMFTVMYKAIETRSSQHR